MLRLCTFNGVSPHNQLLDELVIVMKTGLDDPPALRLTRRRQLAGYGPY